MAYRFKLDEPIQAGFHRIGSAQIDRAIAVLTATRDAAKGDKGTAIHDARKSIKRVRALLRLVRPALPPGVFRQQNSFFRDTAALLSHLRDKEILLETTAKLAARQKGGPHAALDRLRDGLAGSAVVADATDRARTEAAARLRQSAHAFADLRLDPDGFDALGAGLEQSFRRARRAFEAAQAEPSSETVHAWRKTMQQHWRHMALLKDAWPAMAEARLDAARRLSQILGDDNDLTILQHCIETTPPPGLTRADRRVIARLAKSRQAELRALARPLGTQLLADRPSDLARRFAVCWEAAQGVRAAESAIGAIDDDAD